MAVFHARSADFPKMVLEQNKAVLVDFYAPWCGPCRATAPIIEQLAGEYPQMNFVKVDVDECPELATRYEIFSIPTFIIFKNGKVASQFAGATSKENFVVEIKKHLP